MQEASEQKADRAAVLFLLERSVMLQGNVVPNALRGWVFVTSPQYPHYSVAFPTSGSF